MKTHCPACGRATRVAEEVLDFLVRCERCRAMLLARSPASGLVGVKTEVLPLGRIPERFGPAQRTDLAELLTRHRRTTLTGATRSLARRRKTTRGHGLAGACLAVVTASMLGTVVGVGYWKLHETPRPASAATPTLRIATNNPEKSLIRPAPTPVDSSTPNFDDQSSLAPQTPTGTGELFPDVPAKK